MPSTSIEVVHFSLGCFLAGGMPDESGGESEREEVYHTERKFDFMRQMEQFANYDIVRNYVAALKDFSSNPAHVNHYIVKMLHRIATDGKCLPMLFQVSFFRTYSHVLQHPSAKACPEVSGLCEYVMRKFVSMASKNACLVVEALFHTNKSDCELITNGYAIPESKSKHQRSDTAHTLPQKWTEEEDEVVREYYPVYRDNKKVAQLLASMLPNRTSTQVSRRLKVRRAYSIRRICVGCSSGSDVDCSVFAPGTRAARRR